MSKKLRFLGISLISTIVLSTPSVASKRGLCEQLSYGFLGFREPTEAFDRAIKQTSPSEQTEILARLEAYQVLNPHGQVPLGRIREIVNSNYDNKKYSAWAKFATFSGTEVQSFLDGYGIDPSKIPIRNTLRRFLTRALIYNGAMGALLQYALAQVVAPEGGFNFFTQGAPLNYLMFMAMTGAAGAQAISDANHNREAVFMKSLQRALQDPELVGQAERFVSIDNASIHFALLWTRDSAGELHFDIVFWCYQSRDQGEA